LRAEFGETNPTEFAANAQADSRLACQIMVAGALDGLVVR
jgi:ferredoxin